MGKRDDKIMEELSKEVRELLQNYDPALITTVLNKEIMRLELKGCEALSEVHVHVGGKKE